MGIAAIIIMILLGILGLAWVLVRIRRKRIAEGKPVLGDGHWLRKWRNGRL